jgi:hypothetical protein
MVLNHLGFGVEIETYLQPTYASESRRASVIVPDFLPEQHEEGLESGPTQLVGI